MKTSTKQLSEELAKREGVSEIVVNPYEEVEIKVGQQVRKLTGPMIILINED